jgi:hypothetical protein
LEKFQPKIQGVAASSGAFPWSPPPPSAAPPQLTPKKRERDLPIDHVEPTPKKPERENSFSDRLKDFREFGLFCERFPSDGKDDEEMVHSFLMFQRFESLKSND